jgi:hypothetical protein
MYRENWGSCWPYAVAHKPIRRPIVDIIFPVFIIATTINNIFYEK